MPYSETVQAYVTTAPGFTPTVGASGPINITTTLGLDTGAVDFNRAYVPASTTQSIDSIDGNLQLTLVSTDTITYDTYVAVVPSYAPPDPAPVGHRFVGRTYSVRAAGALMVTDRPMSLRLYYDEATLAGADPHTLAIFAWDAYNERWDDLGGRLFYDQRYLSVATSRFATYALMATPTWRDEFYDLSGLDPFRFKNVTWSGGQENYLLLANTPGSGSAVSQPIMPTTAFANWGSLTFTYTVEPPTTTLTVDVLSLDGSEVLTDVASGTSLTDLVGPDQYPSLRLRVNMSSTLAGETPALDVWRLAWQIASSPPPTITAVSPLSASNHITTTLNVTGSGFFSTTQIRLGHTPGVTLPVVTFVTSQTLQGLVPPGLSPGTYDVTVINPDGQNGTLTDAFTVTAPPPRVDSITPAIGLKDSVVHITDLAGAYFQAGAAVKLSQGGGTGVVSATNTVVVSATQITCDFDLTGAVTGTWDVVVTNPDSQSGTLPGGFTVVPPKYIYLPLIMR